LSAQLGGEALIFLRERSRHPNAALELGILERGIVRNRSAPSILKSKLADRAARSRGWTVVG
jgi:hypothetical protein